MTSLSPIRYRGFWDVPRIFLTDHQGQTFLFDSAFDEELDDYPDSYKVYLLPSMQDRELPRDWTTLHTQATQYLGEVAVARIHFDPSKRQSIDSSDLDEVLARKSVAG